MGLPTATQQGFNPAEIVLGVDTKGSFVHLGDVQRKTVLEQAKLFQFFSGLEGTGRQQGEAREGRAAVGIKAHVLPDRGVRVCVTVKGNRGP